jgi:hypothetical protein
MCTVWTGIELSTRALQLPYPLQERFRPLPKLLQVLSTKQRLAAMPALHVNDEHFFTKVKEILTLRTTAALHLLVNRRINVDQDQSVV